MKNYYSLLILILISHHLKAQNLGTDVEGFSTIYTEGSSLGLDVNNDLLNFNFYKSSKWEEKDNLTKRYFYGSTLQGQANNNVSNLFSSGKFNANTNINLVFGLKRFRKYKNIEIDSLESENYKLNDLITTYRHIILESLIKNKPPIVEKSLYDLHTNNPLGFPKKTFSNVTTKLKVKACEEIDWQQIKDDLNSLDNCLGMPLVTLIENLEKLEDAIETSGPLEEWEATFHLFEEILSTEQILNNLNLENDFKTLLEEKKEYNDNKSKIRILKENILPASTTKWLFKLGVSGQEFKYDLDNGSENLDDRFKNQEFTGLSFEFIFNKQFNYYNYIGLSIKGERANNFAALESKDFTLTQMTTNGESTETVSAFTGNYDTFNRYSLNADYMYFFPIGSENEDQNVYININPYLRHFVYENAENLKNSTNLGIGLNLYNSTENKLLGGAFIQANDIFGVQSNEALGKSIAFGLVVKYAFKGFDFKETAE